jgi:hypothetical protein
VDATIPANPAKAIHGRGKIANQVDNVVSNRFRLEDESDCHEDGG